MKYCQECATPCEEFIRKDYVTKAGVERIRVECKCGKFIGWASKFTNEERIERKRARAAFNSERWEKLKSGNGKPYRGKYQNLVNKMVIV